MFSEQMILPTAMKISELYDVILAFHYFESILL